MAALRRSPTVANYGATIPDPTYATLTDTEVEAIWALLEETLGTVAGTNTITAACTPALAAYNTKGYWITPANANTGATTLNIDSLGAKNIKTRTGAALSGGELAAGVPTLLYYTGTEFRIVFSVAAASVTAHEKNYLTGFEMTPNSGTPNDYVDIAAGVARDSTNTTDLVGTAMTKRINAVWAVGTNQGAVLMSANLGGTITITTNTAVSGSGTAFDTDFAVGDFITSNGGQCRRITVITSAIAMTVESAWGSGETGVAYKRGGKARSSKHRVFAIYKDSDATVDYATSARSTPVDLPTGYSTYRRIGYVLTDSSANNRPWIQAGDLFTLKTKIVDVSAVSLTTDVATTVTSSAPPNTIAYYDYTLTALVLDASGTAYTLLVRETNLVSGQGRSAANFYSTDLSGELISRFVAVGIVGTANLAVGLDASAQFVYDWARSTANGSLSMTATLVGWLDRRGRD